MIEGEDLLDWGSKSNGRPSGSPTIGTLKTLTGVGNEIERLYVATRRERAKFRNPVTNEIVPLSTQEMQRFAAVLKTLADVRQASDLPRLEAMERRLAEMERGKVRR